MTTLSIKVSDEQAKHLQKMSHYLSLKRDQHLTISDLVREALELAYPKNKEHDDII
jgi:predicted transcriptional regulator